MVQYINRYDALIVMAERPFNVRMSIMICPDCRDHHHLPPSRESDCNCKNVFVDDEGNSVGQCECYDHCHGGAK